MKKMFKTAMIAFAALTLGLTSCNNEEVINDGVNDVDGNKATLTISLTNPSMTRAAGVSAGSDMNVGEYVAIVLDKNNVIINSVVQNSEATTPQVLETTTAASKVLVITNYNSALTETTGTELKSTITTRADLINEIENDTNNNLANGNSAAITGGENSVWSVGESDPITWAESDFDENKGTYFKSVSVTVRSVVAKIDLTVEVPAEYDPVANPGNFRMTAAGEGVVVLNAVSTTKFFGSKPFGNYMDADYPWLVPATKAYYSGMAPGSYPYVHSSSEQKSFLTDAFTIGTPGEATTLKYSYYLFENDANETKDYPTIVALKGTWGKVLGDSDIDASITGQDRTDIIKSLEPRPIYFPIQLITADAGQYTTVAGGYGKGVQRGKNYNITLRLTKSVFEGAYAFPALPIQDPNDTTVAPGVEDPSEVIAKAQLEVSVIVTDWVSMNIEKEW